MLREEILSSRVGIPVKNLDENKNVPASAIAESLLKKLAVIKACDYGYFLAVTKLISIGQGDSKISPQHVFFPVDFCCKVLKPVVGEVMTGVVHKVNQYGVFIKSGPMSMVYLSARLMPNHRYSDRVFVGEDSSRIEVGVLVRYRVIAAKWVEDKYRDFRVLASIDGDGLGPVSLNGFDGFDL